jgi:hypothetical protein
MVGGAEEIYHYTDNSEPEVGYGENNTCKIVTDQSGIEQEAF